MSQSQHQNDMDAGFLIWISDAAEHGWRVHRLAVDRLRKMANWADAPLPNSWDGRLDKNETAKAVARAQAILKEDERNCVRTPC